MNAEDRVIAESALLDAQEATKLKSNYDPAVKPTGAGYDPKRAKRRQGRNGHGPAESEEEEDSSEEELVDVAEGHFDGGVIPTPPDCNALLTPTPTPSCEAWRNLAYRCRIM